MLATYTVLGAANITYEDQELQRSFQKWTAQENV